MLRDRQRLVLLGLCVLVLLWEVNIIFPRLLEAWKPYDYRLYVEMGAAVRAGQMPYDWYYYQYPMPTILWVFVPLSLMPTGFHMLWSLGSYVSVTVLFRRGGVLTAVMAILFTPLWFAMGDATLDGWLLFPLLWVLEDRPILGGLGASIVLFKPQLAWLTVLYRVCTWVWDRNWKNLGIFGGTMGICYSTAFLVNPYWVAQWWAVLPERVAETTTMYPWAAGSVWSWLWIGNWGIAVFVILCIATLGMFGRTLFHPERRAVAVHLLNLILNPILFGSNMIMTVPVLHERKSILISIIVSLIAFVVARYFNGFGGIYALIPLWALWRLVQSPRIAPVDQATQAVDPA